VLLFGPFCQVGGRSGLLGDGVDVVGQRQRHHHRPPARRSRRGPAAEPPWEDLMVRSSPVLVFHACAKTSL